MTERATLSPGCRELVHALNQRYREQWDRAERLQAELDDIQHSRAFAVFRLLRWLRRWLAPLDRRRQAPISDGSAWSQRPAAACTGRVSIVIPFKDQLGLLRNCLHSLRRGTYRRLEIVLLDNGSTSPAMRRYLGFMGKRRGYEVVPCPGDFNFARLCNAGAQRARGDYVLFLNNDIEVLSRDWLERMMELADDPRVGVVGATLLHPDGKVQHAGMAPTVDGDWEHLGRGQVFDARAAFGVRSVPAVTGACLLMRRDRFLEFGGFDERFPVTDNDVDLCLRARQHGWATVVTPHAQLVHFESLSRGYTRSM